MLEDENFCYLFIFLLILFDQLILKKPSKHDLENRSACKAVADHV
jgi:hypothetical protein